MRTLRLVSAWTNLLRGGKPRQARKIPRSLPTVTDPALCDGEEAQVTRKHVTPVLTTVAAGIALHLGKAAELRIIR